MNLKCKELSERYGINMVLEESPAESAGYRLAKLDMKYWPTQTAAVVKGDLEGDLFYYTNSVHIGVDADVDYIDRVDEAVDVPPAHRGGRHRSRLARRERA